MTTPPALWAPGAGAPPGPAREEESLLALAERCAQDSETHELERARIERQRRALSQALHQHFVGIREEVLGGAFSRGTALRPFTAVDLFLVLDDATHFRHLALGPRGLHKAIHKATQRLGGALWLGAASGGAPAEAPRVAIRVLCEPTLGFTLHPTFREPYVLGGLTMPSRRWNRWIRVNPGALAAVLSEVEAGFGPLLQPALRLAQSWNRQTGARIAPLHLEVLALAGLSTAPPPEDLLDALGLVLAAVARGLGERAATLLPAAQIHADLDEGLSLAERGALRDHAERALSALLLARQGARAAKGGSSPSPHEAALRSWQAQLAALSQ